MFLDDIVSPLTIEEAKSQRMSAQMKLSRAWDREQQKSEASRRRGEEVMAQAKKDAEKKKEQGVAEGAPVTTTPGSIDPGGAVDNFKQQMANNTEKQAGVAEGHADQQRRVFKKNGEPVGEVGIDRESSPGNGQWYMKHYASGNDLVGYDSYEEAVAELKHCMQQGVAEAETDYSKRRQRERDIDAGKPVSRQPKNPQTDYAKKRAKEKRDLEQFGEDDVDDFVKSGGKITYGKPQKGPRRPGLSLASRHIGGGGDKMRMSRTGRAANTQGKPVVAVENSPTDLEFRNQERNAGLEHEDAGTYSVWTQGSKDLKPKCIITKQCSMDDAERHARSIKKKYPFLKVWMQAHHLGKSGFFPMNEDSWSDGQGQWSSEHDQWTKESLEPQNDSKDAVYNAILRRIIGGHASLLGQYGPERVMAAAEDVAEWNSDVEEIGTSDVSGWVRQVFQKLQNNEY